MASIACSNRSYKIPKLLIKILKKIESKIYIESEKIIALSDGMKNEIQKIENEKEKL